jgi:hypothetical protein
MFLWARQYQITLKYSTRDFVVLTEIIMRNIERH